MDVKQLFTIDAGSNSPVTVGSELNLTVTDVPGANYTWSGPNGFTSVEQNPTIQNVQYTAAGPYTVIAKTSTCKSAAITIVVVNDAPLVKPSESLYPNPNNGNFFLKMELEEDRTIPFSVANRAGQIVHEFKLTSVNKLIEENVTLPGYLSAGAYTLKMQIGKEVKVIPFVIKK